MFEYPTQYPTQYPAQHPLQYQPQYRQQSNIGWIMAQSVQQVEQISVQPGQKAWIMVQNEPVFALRTADQMGLVTTEYYRFEKYNPQGASNEYITRAEFDDFVKSIKKVDE